MDRPLFGVVLGTNRGVEGYSNRRSRLFAEANYINGHFTGIKYQCVEYARRWLLLVKSLTFGNIPCACNIWEIKSLTHIETSAEVPLIAIDNGGKIPPHVGALLIYKRRLGLLAGHVAIVTEVNVSKGFIRIAEQNEEDLPWSGDYAREVPMEMIDGRFWLRDKYTLFGWMNYENIPKDYQAPEGGRCGIF